MLHDHAEELVDFRLLLALGGDFGFGRRFVGIWIASPLAASELAVADMAYSGDCRSCSDRSDGVMRHRRRLTACG